MHGPCALRAACAGQDYCPCRVRHLLAEYAELLEQRVVLLERGGGGDSARVRGKRPAHEMVEDQIARKADTALALLALVAADPEIGRAVALAHSLDLRLGRVVFVGGRDEDGRIVAPTARRVGRQVWAGSHAAIVSEVQRALLARMLDEGHEWMARWLGWRPGEAEAA